LNRNSIPEMKVTIPEVSNKYQIRKQENVSMQSNSTTNSNSNHTKTKMR